MKISFFKILLLTIIPIFVFSDCKKRKEHLIIGLWKQETYTLKEDPYPAYWSFDESGILIIKNDDPVSHAAKSEAQYKILMKSLFVPHLEISNSSSFAGLWRIEKLNKKVLVICRVANLSKENKAHPYLRREFVRAD